MNEKVSLPRKVSDPLVSLKVSPIQEALEDFTLSRRAMRCTAATMEHYRFTAGKFVEWLERQGITLPNMVKAGHVRAWLGADANRLKPASLHSRARGVRTLLRFWHSEGYLTAPIPVAMPRLEMGRLPVLDRDEVKAVLETLRVRCNRLGCAPLSACRPREVGLGHGLGGLLALRRRGMLSMCGR